MTIDDMLLPLSLWAYDVEAAHKAKGGENGRFQYQSAIQPSDTTPAAAVPHESAEAGAGADPATAEDDLHGPNSSSAVFDKEEALFFLLSVDANGNKAPVKIGRFVLEDAPEPGSDNITKADLEAFRAEIRGMIASITNREDAE